VQAWHDFVADSITGHDRWWSLESLSNVLTNHKTLIKLGESHPKAYP
jgi:hypothetical protein